MLGAGPFALIAGDELVAALVESLLARGGQAFDGLGAVALAERVDASGKLIARLGSLLAGSSERNLRWSAV